MKRLGLTLVAAFCLAVTTFAADNQPTVAKWEGNINVSRLGKFLKLSSVQTKEVVDICSYFDQQMGEATTARKDRNTMIRKAVYGNLKLMKETLTKDQYLKYTTLLNMTLNNKGIRVK